MAAIGLGIFGGAIIAYLNPMLTAFFDSIPILGIVLRLVVIGVVSALIAATSIFIPSSGGATRIFALAVYGLSALLTIAIALGPGVFIGSAVGFVVALSIFIAPIMLFPIIIAYEGLGRRMGR